jgi:hypothetical protein
MIPLTFILALSLAFSQAHSYCPPGNCPGVMRFTCEDYTAGLVLILRKYGVDAYPIEGWANHGLHDWVGVEYDGLLYNIEPQTGKVVYPNPEFSVSYYWGGRRAVARGVV